MTTAEVIRRAQKALDLFEAPRSTSTPSSPAQSTRTDAAMSQVTAAPSLKDEQTLADNKLIKNGRGGRGQGGRGQESLVDAGTRTLVDAGFLIAEQDKSSQEKREESVTELREGLLKMIKCVLDVGDAVILSLDAKDPLECTHQELLIAHDLLREKTLSVAEALKGRQLLEKLGSIEVVMQTHTEVIAAQSATIMEQNAQINEHRRRLSFFWENGPPMSPSLKTRQLQDEYVQQSHGKDPQLQDVCEQLAVARMQRDEAWKLRDKHRHQSEKLCSKLEEMVKKHEELCGSNDQLGSTYNELQNMHLQLQGEVQAVTLQRDEYLQQLLQLQVEVRAVTLQRDEYFEQLKLPQLFKLKTGNEELLQQLKMKEAENEELQEELLKHDKAKLQSVTEKMQLKKMKLQLQALARLQQEKVELQAELERVKELLHPL